MSQRVPSRIPTCMSFVSVVPSSCSFVSTWRRTWRRNPSLVSSRWTWRRRARSVARAKSATFLYTSTFIPHHQSPYTSTFIPRHQSPYSQPSSPTTNDAFTTRLIPDFPPPHPSPTPGSTSITIPRRRARSVSMSIMDLKTLLALFSNSKQGLLTSRRGGQVYVILELIMWTAMCFFFLGNLYLDTSTLSSTPQGKPAPPIQTQHSSNPPAPCKNF